MFIRFPAPNASSMRAAPKKPQSTPIRVSRIPKADHSTPPLAVKCWRTLMASSANIGDRIVPSRRFRSRKTKMAACSVITGIRWREVWRSSTPPSRSAKKRPAVRCGDWARARLRRRKFRSCSTRMVASSMLEHIFEGVNGDSVYRGASFLAGKLGEQIASANVTVIDDGTLPGGFGTTPFDGEGIPTATHRRDRKWNSEIVSSEYLHGQETRSRNHRERIPRTGWHARHWPGKLLSCNLALKLHSKLLARSKMVST